MNKSEIIKNNLIIAEFMGLVEYNNRWSSGRVVQFQKGTFVDYNAVGKGILKYDSSWDWLMPVVEKIENMSNAAFYEKSTGKVSEYFDFPFLIGKEKYSKDTNIDFDIRGRNAKVSVFEYIPDDVHREFKETEYFNFDSLQIPELDKKNPKTWRTKLENVWLACIEFIKWYNKNQKEVKK